MAESTLEKRRRAMKEAEAAIDEVTGRAKKEAFKTATAPKLPDKLPSAKMSEEERRALRLPTDEHTFEAEDTPVPSPTPKATPFPTPTPKKTCRTVVEKTKFGRSTRQVCE